LEVEDNMNDQHSPPEGSGRPIAVALRTGALLGWDPATGEVTNMGIPVSFPPRHQPFVKLLFATPGAVVTAADVKALYGPDDSRGVGDGLWRIRQRLGSTDAVQTVGPHGYIVGYRLNIADRYGYGRITRLQAGNVVYFPHDGKVARVGACPQCLEPVEEELLVHLIRRVGGLVRWHDVAAAARVPLFTVRHAANTLADKLGGDASEVIGSQEGCRLGRGTAKVMRVDRLELALSDSEARVRGIPIPLEAGEPLVLAALASRPGTTVPRHELVGALKDGQPHCVLFGGQECSAVANPVDVDVYRRAVDSYVAGLQDKLPCGHELIIQVDDGYMLDIGEQLAVGRLLLDLYGQWAACGTDEEHLTELEAAVLAKAMEAFGEWPHAADDGALEHAGGQEFLARLRALRKKLVPLCGLKEGADLFTKVERIQGTRPPLAGYRILGEDLGGRLVPRPGAGACGV
jgi:DNA-binding response OmpR family regulator